MTFIKSCCDGVRGLLGCLFVAAFMSPLAIPVIGIIGVSLIS